jgi:hypothetical protein
VDRCVLRLEKLGDGHKPGAHRSVPLVTRLTSSQLSSARAHVFVEIKPTVGGDENFSDVPEDQGSGSHAPHTDEGHVIGTPEVPAREFDRAGRLRA